jgi:hypothetical protein
MKNIIDELCQLAEMDKIDEITEMIKNNNFLVNLCTEKILLFNYLFNKSDSNELKSYAIELNNQILFFSIFNSNIIEVKLRNPLFDDTGSLKQELDDYVDSIAVNIGYINDNNLDDNDDNEIFIDNRENIFKF